MVPVVGKTYRTTVPKKGWVRSAWSKSTKIIIPENTRAMCIKKEDWGFFKFRNLNNGRAFEMHLGILRDGDLVEETQ